MSNKSIVLTVIIIVAIHAVILFLALTPDTTTKKPVETAPVETMQEPVAKEPEPVVKEPVIQEPVVKGPAVSKQTEGKPQPKTQAQLKPQGKPLPSFKPQSPEKVQPPTKTQAQTKPQVQPTVEAPLLKLTLATKRGSFDASHAVTGDLAVHNRWKKASKNATGLLIDLDSRKVIWQKNPEKIVPIASLTKIMTLMLAYEKCMEPNAPYHLDSLVPVTAEARNVPPSGVAFQPDETSFPLRKLMIAAAVKSANDAAYLIAQSFGGGSVDPFIRAMNERAKQLGMKNTTYYNPHGLPGKGKHPDNKSTVLDLAYLCEAYLTYPELHKWASLRIADFRTKGDLANHNNLLPGARTACKGVSGIKTGFTNNAGFCVAAYCSRGNRRLLAIVTGFPSAKDRDNYVLTLLEWGFKRGK